MNKNERSMTIIALVLCVALVATSLMSVAVILSH